MKLTEKLGLTEEELKNKLKNLYEGGESQIKISNILHTYPGTIDYYLRKFNISVRTRSESARMVKMRHIKLVPSEMEIFNGLLLSDMHIDIGTFQGRLTFGVLHKEFADAIINALPNFLWKDLYPYKPNNSPNINYFCKSTFCVQLFELHKIWYNDRIKKVPENLNIISPTTLYWWYLGDGYICKKRNQIALCTDAFLKEENERLCSILNKTYNINLKVDAKNRISMYGNNNIQKFFGIIGDPKLKCYEYKWRS